MVRERALLAGRLLAIAVVAGSLPVTAAVPSALAAGTGQDAATGSSSEILWIEPDENALTGTEPVAYVVTVENPEDSRIHPTQVEIGVEPSDADVDLRVGAGEPWYVDSANRLWSDFPSVPNGDREVYGVSVLPESGTGEYNVTATVYYFDDGNYTQERRTAALTVGSCRFGTDWAACNASWLLPLLTFFVGVLSFFGYDRVRGRLRTVDSIGDTTDDRS